eukprot:TRINITY_DN10992_c0_g1_i1.p1 TRINITY_DN10992_c0_g1~~TRINITY_DN10992_c0_g1_i1.p1  ORF type:complete len:207 (+),score=61.53 TRINITY_DN10992_c0_g1_i1:27-647(+)
MAPKFFCLVAFIGISFGQPAPPVIPQLFHVDLGTVTCLNVTSTACMGAAYGVIQAYYRFDDEGWLMNYREDTVFSNTSLVYNREYFNTTDQYEFFLMGDAAPTLQCFHNPVTAVTFSRYFMVNGTYAGTQVINGMKFFTYSNTVSINGEVFTIYGFVRDDGTFAGWQLGGVIYMFYHFQVVSNFPDELWTPPKLDTPCYGRNSQAV